MQLEHGNEGVFEIHVLEEKGVVVDTVGTDVLTQATVLHRGLTCFNYAN